MRASQALAEGRAAYDAGSWSKAAARLAEADRDAPLGPEDLDRLAVAAYLTGDDSAGVDARARAHAGFLERGEPVRAAASAFWLAFSILDQPQQRSQAAGWLARARRLVEDAGVDCVEQGWLLCASAFQQAAAGDPESARVTFAEAAAIGERFRCRELVTLARHGQGRALVYLTRIAEGLALLDEVMLAVTSGEVGPMVAGVVYCSVISACHDVFDVRRAQEWTGALSRWCAAQPDLVPFRGQCLVRRSEVMQLKGAWQDAAAEASRACERLAEAGGREGAGAARYQLAEMHRLLGHFAEADEGYRLASQAGRRPYPGMALLRLAQGQIGAAVAAIRSALQEARDRRTRVRLLPAAVEILLASHDRDAARATADELARIAGALDTPFLRAVSSQARGAVTLEAGDAAGALVPLRAACTAWEELEAPYEMARVRVLVGLAYRQLGDHDGAELELDAAHEIFDRIGAAVDAARAAALAASGASRAASGLTGREVEVLRLIATGATNRAIAARLAISEKTVARHVSNIFTKLDLPSRAAATAYAYEHKLL